MMPDEIIQDLDPAETGYTGCLLPEIEGEGSDEGHCDAEAEDDDG